MYSNPYCTQYPCGYGYQPPCGYNPCYNPCYTNPYCNPCAMPCNPCSPCMPPFGPCNPCNNPCANPCNALAGCGMTNFGGMGCIGGMPRGMSSNCGPCCQSTVFPMCIPSMSQYNNQAPPPNFPTIPFPKRKKKKKSSGYQYSYDSSKDTSEYSTLSSESSQRSSSVPTEVIVMNAETPPPSLGKFLYFKIQFYIWFGRVWAFYLNPCRCRCVSYPCRKPLTTRFWNIPLNPCLTLILICTTRVVHKIVYNAWNGKSC